MKLLDRSITSVRGIRASGVACGLKKNNLPDLALVVSDVPTAAAGVFTRNVVKGHSLQLTRSHLQKSGYCRAVIINSGNANACIGEAGLQDAEKMARMVAQQIGCAPKEVLTGSTGVIGQRLNMLSVRDGIGKACAQLTAADEGGYEAARAILTTDLVSKNAAVQIDIAGRTVTVAGMAKGSGMIHPDMATMIALIATDGNIPAPLLDSMLRRANDRSFNRISVDGDTSVCDMVLLLANGQAGNEPIQPDSPQAKMMQEALDEVFISLARQVAADGEGATKLVEIRAEGLASRDDALKIVSAVARSPLVKTALFGEDANWGRIITAAGYSGADFNPENCSIYIGDLQVCAGGRALGFSEEQAKKILQQREIMIRIVLQEGDACEHMWTCDFSYDYIRINGSYRS